MFERKFESFIGCCDDYQNSQLVICGAPFDSTTSYRPGARFGSSAIRHESYGIELYSPYQDKEISDFFIFDAGDIELPFGSCERTLDILQDAADVILSDGKIPLMLGGEHLVSLAAIRAAAKQFPDLRIIHFDAHADLRDEYLGQSLSHASVMRRSWDILGDGKIFQFGIRSGDKSEFEWARDHVYMCRFDFSKLEEIIKKLKGYPIYLTIDLDVLDSGIFCGTGTPEAGGVSFLELLEAIFKVSKLNIIGADMVELAPNLDPSGASTALACKLLREMIIALLSNK